MIHVAVCMPSTGRADQMYSRATDLLYQERPSNVFLWLVLAIPMDDVATLKRARDLQRVWGDGADSQVLIVEREPGSTAVEGWNLAYSVVATVADWFVLGADDIIWHEGWVEDALRQAEGAAFRQAQGAVPRRAALRQARVQAGVIGLNDGHTNLDEYAPHYMVSRAFAREHLGGVLVPPMYKSWWFDREVCEKARALGLYAPAWKTWCEHRHPDWKTAAMDETYEAAWPTHDEDRAVYLARQAAGFPVDYEPAAKEWA